MSANNQRSDKDNTESKPQKTTSSKENKDAVKQMDELEQEAEKTRGRKPGSQSNSSSQHNNGRGGGK